MSEDKSNIFQEWVFILLCDFTLNLRMTRDSKVLENISLASC